MSHVCSKCNKFFSLHEASNPFNKSTYKLNKLFSHMDGSPYATVDSVYNISYVEYFICPDQECGNIDVKISGEEDFFPERTLWFNPLSNAKTYPEIDDEVNKYYKEAHAVLPFSPRASAALSRACLESLLSKKYNLSGRLNSQITELEKKIISRDIPLNPSFIDPMHGIRLSGNASLHEEIKVEITFEEANYVLFVIEMFLDEIYIHEKSRENKLKAVADLKSKIQKNKN